MPSAWPEGVEHDSKTEVMHRPFMSSTWCNTMYQFQFPGVFFYLVLAYKNAHACII